MHLIDKEELKKQILEEYPQAYYPIHYIKLIDRAPVIEERKKGKWVRITQGAMPEQYICPFCHRTVKTHGAEKLLKIRYPYCHCGAKMEGEEK